MHIKIITTGGTLDKIYFDQKSEFQVGDPQIGEVLKEANITLDYEIIPLLKKDSLELTEADRKLVYERIRIDDCRHFVVTHGTDTMADTGKLLLTLKDKVIVLTGAMQPAKFRFTDAVYNIASAMTAVQLMPNGVYIAMNGRIFEAANVKKNVPLNRFEEIQ